MDSHDVAMKKEDHERFSISPPALKITTSSMFSSTLLDLKSDAESFSKIAQKMVDEQLSICNSFKFKIEQSLLELHEQWNHNGRRVPKEADSPRDSKASSAKCMLEHVSTCDRPVPLAESSRTFAGRGYSPRSGESGYPISKGLDATKTAIHKPHAFSEQSYRPWDSKSSSHCKSPPYRVPARKSQSTLSTEMPSDSFAGNRIPAYSVKLEDMRDDRKSAFTTYTASPGRLHATSPSFYRRDANPDASTTSSSGRMFVDQQQQRFIQQQQQQKEPTTPVKDEPAERISHSPSNTQLPVQRFEDGNQTRTQRADSAIGISQLLHLTQVANEHLAIAVTEPKTQKRRTKGKGNDCLHLWEFLRDLLNKDDQQVRCIEWTCKERGEFRLIKTAVVAKLWGKSKNRHQMTYEKMARAMRYYYKMNILEKVPNKRLHFRFGVHMLPKLSSD